MRVKAIEKTYYAGKEYLPGEEFEMDDRQSVDINILTVLKKIEVLKQQPAAPKYATKVVRAEEPPPEQPKSTAVGPITTDDMPTTPRFYRRRDMKARE